MKTLTAISSDSMAADVTVQARIDDDSGFAWQVVCVGTPTGPIYLQASCDDTTWETIDTVNAAGADISKLWNVTGGQYPLTRVFFDRTSGSGTMTTYLWKKEGK
jgi:hypothetical protein